MTPDQLADRALTALSLHMSHPAMPAWRKDAVVALAAMVSPVCSDKDCETVDSLVRCNGCGFLYCGRHLVHWTGCAGDDGAAGYCCFDCLPGPDPQEF